MLEKQLYIDGQDAFLQWGVVSSFGGWNELIAYPPLKSIETNDWQEEDGIEPDLSLPVLNTREVSVVFNLVGLFHNVQGLVELLSDGAYHLFECFSIGRVYRLRMTQTPALTDCDLTGSVTFKFSDDFPLAQCPDTTPSSTIARYDDYHMDGNPFTNYGGRILQGTLDSIKKPANVKLNLVRNISTQSGASYDGSGKVTFKSKEAAIRILMRADSLPELWNNYYNLLVDLVKPGERTLYVRALEQDFPFYYKSAKVEEFYPTDKIWLVFTITIVMTRDFRITDNVFLLADNENNLIYDNDEETAFEIKKYHKP